MTSRQFFFTLVVCLIAANTFAQLPLFKINTFEKAIVDEPKIKAELTVVENQQITLTQNIGVEYRGTAAQFFPKKSLAIETKNKDWKDKKNTLLGLPKEEDWVLYAPFTDKSLLRNVLAYQLWNEMGHYASRFRFVEVEINDKYQGVYILFEKIKQGKNRVAIEKSDKEKKETSFIVSIDKKTTASNNEDFLAFITKFKYEYPKAKKLSSEHKDYIQRSCEQFETALLNNNFLNDTIGYQKYIDVQSFIDFMLLTEFTKNIDGYRLSTFLHKSETGKLTMGPVWDFNIAFGIAKDCNGYSPEGWMWDFNKVCPKEKNLVPFWWTRLLEDPNFVEQLKIRWLEIRKSFLFENYLNGFIDKQIEVLGTAKDRNFKKWLVLDQPVWPDGRIRNTYEAEIVYLKKWMQQRLQWMDAELQKM